VPTLRRFLRTARPLRTTADQDEIAALQLVLAGDDPRFGVLLEQLRTAPEVRRRHPTPDRVTVSPTSAANHLWFPLEVRRLESAWVPAVDSVSGRGLEFRAVVVRSGFLEALEGRTADGDPWPARWRLDPPTHSGQMTAALVLPSLAELDAEHVLAREGLERWLGAELATDVEVFPPPSEAAIARREADLGVRFTPGYRELLTITDGIEARDIRVLSHRDAYRVDDPRFDGLVVVWDGDNADNFVGVLTTDGHDETLRRVDVHARDRELVDVAPSLASHLRDRLGREESRPVR
jgi:hypothetical protein